MDCSPSHDRRTFVLYATTSLSLLLPACGLWSDKPVAVAAHNWVGYEPMFLAQSRAWLDPNRVSLLATADARESIAALRSGRVQAAALTLDEVLSVRSSALALVVVLVFNVSMGADMLLVKPQINTLAQLRGQRIGLEASSVADILISETLRAAGLRLADVNLLRLPIDTHVVAWQRHDVDALLTYEPVASQLQALGMERLFGSQQLPETIVDVLAVRQDALDAAHASAWRHLLAGHFKAIDAIVRNPQDSAYRMAARLGLPATDVMRAFKGLELPGVSRNYDLLGGASPRLRAVAERLLPIVKARDSNVSTDDFSALFTASYLPTEDLLK